MLASAAVATAQAMPAAAAPVSSPPPAPAIGQYSQLLAPPVTGHEKSRTDAKAADAAALFARAETEWRAASGESGMAEPAVAVSKTLGVPYYQQQTENWCGPTTLAMIAGYKGKGWSGSEYTKELAAAELVTDPELAALGRNAVRTGMAQTVCPAARGLRGTQWRTR